MAFFSGIGLFPRGGNMDKLFQALTKYRTSTLIIGSGLNSHMMESRKLIGAQFLNIKLRILWKLRAVFNQRGNLA